MWQLHDYKIEVRIAYGRHTTQYFKDGYRLFGDYILGRGFQERSTSTMHNPKLDKDSRLIFVWED